MAAPRPLRCTQKARCRFIRQKGAPDMNTRIENMTTLCYLQQGDCWLMLHRVKKKNDINHDKWLGVGGHFEEGESP